MHACEERMHGWAKSHLQDSENAISEATLNQKYFLFSKPRVENLIIQSVGRVISRVFPHVVGKLDLEMSYTGPTCAVLCYAVHSHSVVANSLRPHGL